MGVAWRAGDCFGLDKFNAGKFISGLPVEQMDKAEFELLRYPRAISSGEAL